jgi:hypothetical protein
MAGAEKSMESSFCSYNFSIAYAVKFFGPSASLAVENKPNKVGTRFFGTVLFSCCWLREPSKRGPSRSNGRCGVWGCVALARLAFLKVTFRCRGAGYTTTTSTALARAGSFAPESLPV